MMQARSTIALLLAVILACACFGGVAASRPASGVDRWEQRLARLDPVRPIDYLELGEEVADSASSAAEKRLARELFGFAGALDPARLGRSAMLALASIAETDAERARAQTCRNVTAKPARDIVQIAFCGINIPQLYQAAQRRRRIR